MSYRLKFNLQCGPQVTLLDHLLILFKGRTEGSSVYSVFGEGGISRAEFKTRSKMDNLCHVFFWRGGGGGGGGGGRGSRGRASNWIYPECHTLLAVTDRVYIILPAYPDDLQDQITPEAYIIRQDRQMICRAVLQMNHVVDYQLTSNIIVNTILLLNPRSFKSFSFFLFRFVSLLPLFLFSLK